MSLKREERNAMTTRCPLLSLNQMLYYALCLSYHSNTEAALFACLSWGWATTTGRLLDPNVGNSIKCLTHRHSDALPHRELNQEFATFRLLAWRFTNWVLWFHKTNFIAKCIILFILITIAS